MSVGKKKILDHVFHPDYFDLFSGFRRKVVLIIHHTIGLYILQTQLRLHWEMAHYIMQWMRYHNWIPPVAYQWNSNALATMQLRWIKNIRQVNQLIKF